MVPDNGRHLTVIRASFVTLIISIIRSKKHPIIPSPPSVLFSRLSLVFLSSNKLLLWCPYWFDHITLRCLRVVPASFVVCCYICSVYVQVVHSRLSINSLVHFACFPLDLCPNDPRVRVTVWIIMPYRYRHVHPPSLCAQCLCHVSVADDIYVCLQRPPRE